MRWWRTFGPALWRASASTTTNLRKIKPDLVYCSISGYGQSGPKSPLPAFDGAIQAASGMMAVSGFPGDVGPVRAGYFAVDMATALHAAFALAAALYRKRPHRRRPAHRRGDDGHVNAHARPADDRLPDERQGA